MSDPNLPTVEDKIIETPWGSCIGHRVQWPGGQYCGLLTHRGIVGCGAYDVRCMEEFGMLVAIAKGTPAKPLMYAEDLLDATIVDMTRQAAAAGIAKGMTGREALRVLLESAPPAQQRI